jgi:ADP-heptose:LPS heptosyltransferase
VTTALVVRLDSDGDVLLAGPALRAVRAGCERLVLVCGPRGAGAAALLPGVDEVLVWHCPWVDPEPTTVDEADVPGLVRRLRALAVDRALILTSHHQSPLPMALVLRLAGVPWIGAVSEDYPGALLNLRHRLPAEGLHEVERALSLVLAAGYPVTSSQLRVRRPLPDTRPLTGPSPYVVVHPCASVPSRAPSPGWMRGLVTALTRAGHRVVVTGGPTEQATTAVAAGGLGLDLGGRTSLAQLADVLARALCAVVGNTGPAHLAAAVGTPVVSLFSPVVPALGWQPWGVPTALLGDQQAACRLTYARTCPVPDHPCLDGIDHADVVSAVGRLARDLEASA